MSLQHVPGDDAPERSRSRRVRAGPWFPARETGPSATGRSKLVVGRGVGGQPGGRRGYRFRSESRCDIGPGDEIHTDTALVVAAVAVGFRAAVVPGVTRTGFDREAERCVSRPNARLLLDCKEPDTRLCLRHSIRVRHRHGSNRVLARAVRHCGTRKHCRNQQREQRDDEIRARHAWNFRIP